MNDTMMQDELDFEAMMEQRMSVFADNEGGESVSVTNERLQELNKKLPSWSLEPPYSFLK